MLLLLLCDSAGETATMIHDVASCWAGPGIVYTVILVYVTGDAGYPNRGAAGQQPFLFLYVVVFDAAFFRVLLELLGLVFVEFASERG